MLYRKEIPDYLRSLGIPFEMEEHPAAFTMAELDALGITQKGIVLKNLFLRDGSGKHHYLVSAPEEAEIDLKILRQQLGSSRLSFASAERLQEHLHITQGSVSPLCLLNDETCSIPFVLDEAVKNTGRIGVHPNENTAMLWMAAGDLCDLIRSHGNPILFSPFLHR